MARQQILYEPAKRFHFVITEAALRYRLVAPEVMLAQLDRLIGATALPNVRLGVISNRTTYVNGPLHGFWLLDDSLVMIETFSAELNLAQAHEIDIYTRTFMRLAPTAEYGASARGIIATAMEELTRELPEEPAQGETPSDESF